MCWNLFIYTVICLHVPLLDVFRVPLLRLLQLQIATDSTHLSTTTTATLVSIPHRSTAIDRSASPTTSTDRRSIRLQMMMMMHLGAVRSRITSATTTSTSAQQRRVRTLTAVRAAFVAVIVFVRSIAGRLEPQQQQDDENHSDQGTGNDTNDHGRSFLHLGADAALVVVAFRRSRWRSIDGRRKVLRMFGQSCRRCLVVGVRRWISAKFWWRWWFGLVWCLGEGVARFGVLFGGGGGGGEIVLRCGWGPGGSGRCGRSANRCGGATMSGSLRCGRRWGGTAGGRCEAGRRSRIVLGCADCFLFVRHLNCGWGCVLVKACGLRTCRRTLVDRCICKFKKKLSLVVFGFAHVYQLKLTLDHIIINEINSVLIYQCLNWNTFHDHRYN